MFPSHNSRAFLMLTATSIVGVTFELLSIYTNTYCSLTLPLITNFANIIHIISVNLTPVLYYYFILSLTHSNAELPNSIKYLLDGTVYYILLTTITSPWSHWTMFNDENGIYQHGSGMLVLYVIAASYIVLGFVHCIKFRNKIKTSNIVSIGSFSIVLLVAMVYQYFHPNCLIISFGMSISLLICFLTMKNPLAYIHRSTDTYNKEAFTEFLNTAVNSKKPMTLIFFELENFDLLKIQIGTSNAYKLFTIYLKHINNVCENKYLFHITGNTYGFFCENGETSFEKTKILQETSKTPFYINLNENASRIPSYRILLSIYKIDNLSIFRRLKDKHRFLLTNEIIDILKFAIAHYKMTDYKSICEIDNAVFDIFYKNKAIVHTVQSAIQNESFEVFLQPIYSIKQKRFIGAESLIRLKGADGKYISPVDFIPEAEHNGDILRIGDISLKKTCEFILETNLIGSDIETINVNLSVMQCFQENVVDHLLEIISSYNLPKEIFRFEITESLASEDDKNFAIMFDSLTEQGIQIALDDYGTGFSNTARLMSYPFFEIKFDKSLIDLACKDEQNLICLKHLVSMANEKGMVTLAEGIEDEPSATLIKEIGCSLIQGFYYAKPMNKEDFKKFLKKINNSSKTTQAELLSSAESDVETVIKQTVV